MSIELKILCWIGGLLGCLALTVLVIFGLVLWQQWRVGREIDDEKGDRF